ncbi:AOC3-like protein [Mya arenaria]|uniref:Amine oxidase n=1 Tax=Mya arenaria TaxID=6604 RepID=A0ABY7E167_MYAAR|nr:retina-specific copper amine oxidase-like [Mya arenaria]WAR02695.1 AOC3-like protein [Mya arenaria]
MHHQNQGMDSRNHAYDVDGGEGKGKLRRSNLSCRELCWLQMFAVLMFGVGIAGGILIGIYAYHAGPESDGSTQCPTLPPQGSQCGNAHSTPSPNVNPKEQDNNEHASGTLGECPTTNPVTGTRYESTVFAPLTTAEMYKAAKFLKDNGVVSTLNAPTSLFENFILYQWLDVPTKTAALDFLDNGGPKPQRHAKVTVQRGQELDIMEYRVGPLDSNVMTINSLNKPGDVQFNSRPYDGLEVGIMTQMLEKDMTTLAPLIAESFDGAKYPEDLVFNLFNGPPSTSGVDRDTRWVITYNGFKGADVDLIHILPLSGRVHNPGSNVSQWYTYDFHYLNQGPYRTASDLMNAYNRNEIRKVKLEKGYKDTTYDRIFPKRDSGQPYRENADRHGPRVYYPSGPRYTIDGTHVKWMDWSFDISGGQIRGPALFDIKFRNERILYELAVNDISLNYAMDSHSQNNIIYADATYGILGGLTPTTIMKGVDCPEHGTVLQTSFWLADTQLAYNMSSICVFEADGQDALWRHAGSSFEAGMRNRYLVVRVPTVIGNYDYTFEFDFYLDGKIFNYAKASGYIQASFWDEHDPKWPDKSRDAFGYRISDYMTGPIHDHMFGYKVDFDIIDRNNTFQVVKWKAGPALEALQTQNASITKAPEYFIYNETRYIEWEKMAQEKGIRKTPEQQFWLVVNEREKNKWGVERGYQIAPLQTGSQALINHPLLKALSFTKYHCAVTKRKEEEPTLTSIYDVNRMDNPQAYLDKHIDGESILDEDIVNWVTVGFLHVPIAEDMPMTVRVETGFLLKPFNFFDRTATFDMPQYTDTKDGSLKESEPLFDQCSEPKTHYCRFC